MLGKKPQSVESTVVSLDVKLDRFLTAFRATVVPTEREEMLKAHYQKFPGYENVNFNLDDNEKYKGKLLKTLLDERLITWSMLADWLTYEIQENKNLVFIYLVYQFHTKIKSSTSALAEHSAIEQKAIQTLIEGFGIIHEVNPKQDSIVYCPLNLWLDIESQREVISRIIREICAEHDLSKASDQAFLRYWVGILYELVKAADILPELPKEALLEFNNLKKARTALIASTYVGFQTRLLENSIAELTACLSDNSVDNQAFWDSLWILSADQVAELLKGTFKRAITQPTDAKLITRLFLRVTQLHLVANHHSYKNKAIQAALYKFSGDHLPQFLLHNNLDYLIKVVIDLNRPDLLVAVTQIYENAKRYDLLKQLNLTVLKKLSAVCSEINEANLPGINFAIELLCNHESYRLKLVDALPDFYENFGTSINPALLKKLTKKSVSARTAAASATATESAISATDDYLRIFPYNYIKQNESSMDTPPTSPGKLAALAEIQGLIADPVDIAKSAARLMKLDRQAWDYILPEVHKNLHSQGKQEGWQELVYALVFEKKLNLESFSSLFPIMLKNKDYSSLATLAGLIIEYSSKAGWDTLAEDERKAIHTVFQHLVLLYTNSIIDGEEEQANILKIRILLILDDVLSKASQQGYFEYEMKLSLGILAIHGHSIKFTTYAVIEFNAWLELFYASKPSDDARLAMKKFIEPDYFQHALSSHANQLKIVKEHRLFEFLPKFTVLALFQTALDKYLAGIPIDKQPDKKAKLTSLTEERYDRLFNGKATFKGGLPKIRDTLETLKSCDVPNTAFELWRLYLLMHALGNNEKLAFFKDIITKLLQETASPAPLKDQLKTLAEESKVPLITEFVHGIENPIDWTEFDVPTKSPKKTKLKKVKPVETATAENASGVAAVAQAGSGSLSKPPTRVTSQKPSPAMSKAEAERTKLETQKLMLDAVTRESLAGMSALAETLKAKPETAREKQLLELIDYYQTILNSQLPAAEIASDKGEAKLLALCPDSNPLLRILINWRKALTDGHAKLKGLIPKTELDHLSKQFNAVPNIKLKLDSFEKQAAKAQFNQVSERLLPLIRQYYWDLAAFADTEPRARYRQILLQCLHEQIYAAETLICGKSGADNLRLPRRDFPGEPLAANATDYFQLATQINDTTWKWNEILNDYALQLKSGLQIDPSQDGLHELEKELTGYYHQQIDDPALWQLHETFPEGNVRVFGTGVFYPGAEDWDVRVNLNGSVPAILAQVAATPGLRPVPEEVLYHAYDPALAPSGTKKVLAEVQVKIAVGVYFDNTLPLDLHFSSNHDDDELLQLPVAQASVCVTIARGAVRVSHKAMANMREGVLACAQYEINWTRKEEMPQDFKLVIRCLARFAENLALSPIDSPYSLSLDEGYQTLIDGIQAILHRDSGQARILLQNLQWIWDKVSPLRQAALTKWYQDWGLELESKQWQIKSVPRLLSSAGNASIFSPPVSPRRSSSDSNHSTDSVNSGRSVASVMNQALSVAPLEGPVANP